MQVTGNNIPSPHKSIRLSMDGLSFFQANAWKHTRFVPNDLQLEQALARLLCEPALQDLHLANIEVDYPYTTLVPSQLLSNQDALSVFTFHFPETNTDKLVVCAQEIAGFNITLLFGIPQLHYRLANQLFSHIKWSHMLLPCIQQCLKSTKQKGETQAWIQAKDSYANIAVANNGNLLFSNYFPIQHPNDLLYYTAKVFEQYQLSQQHTPTYFIGNQETHQLLVKHLALCQQIEDYAHC